MTAKPRGRGSRPLPASTTPAPPSPMPPLASLSSGEHALHVHVVTEHARASTSCMRGFAEVLFHGRRSSFGVISRQLLRRQAIRGIENRAGGARARRSPAHRTCFARGHRASCGLRRKRSSPPSENSVRPSSTERFAASRYTNETCSTRRTAKCDPRSPERTASSGRAEERSGARNGRHLVELVACLQRGQRIRLNERCRAVAPCEPSSTPRMRAVSMFSAFT